MEAAQENAPLVPEIRAGNTEYGALAPPATTRGVSNGRACRIAGLTTLACLLVASQVFTAYLLYDQNQQIHNLQTESQDMRREMEHSRSRNVQVRLPLMNSMPLLTDFTKAGNIQPTKNAPATVVGVDEQVKNFLQDAQLPRFNETFLDNLQSLKGQMEESQWKSFESWMRHWLIFQMAQQAPGPSTVQEDYYDYDASLE